MNGALQFLGLLDGEQVLLEEREEWSELSIGIVLLHSPPLQDAYNLYGILAQSFIYLQA